MFVKFDGSIFKTFSQHVNILELKAQVNFLAMFKHQGRTYKPTIWKTHTANSLICSKFEVKVEVLALSAVKHVSYNFASSYWLYLFYLWSTKIYETIPLIGK